MSPRPNAALEPSSWRLLAQAIAGREADLSTLGDMDLPRIAAWHGIGPLLDRRAHEGSLTGLTKWVREALHHQARHTAVTELAMQASTRRLMTHFDENAIDSLLLKGAAVAEHVYPDAFLRPRCDTDVWVRETEAGDVAETLSAFGYRVVNLSTNTASSRQFQATPDAFQGEHLWFDIHYRLSNRSLFRDTLGFQECLDHALPLQRVGAMSPALPGLLLHAALHRVAHGRNSASQRMIWLYDIHLLYEAMAAGDRLAFTDLALDRAQGTLCATALEASRAAFGTAVSDKRLQTLSSGRATEPSARLLDAGRWAWAWSDLRGQESVRKKVAFGWELLRGRFNG